MVSGPRSRVEVLILAVLLVATGLLGSGITLAVKEGPSEPAHAAWPDSLDLDGPLTLVVDDDPFLEIDPDGTVRFLASPDLLASLPAPTLGVLEAGTGCPDGGATITSQWGTNSTQATVCDGGAGPTGEMGPEGMRFMVKVAPFPGPMGAECENGGYLLLMGRDTGNGAATAYDGVLDVDEIVHEVPICHGVGRVGERGPQGEQGIQGVQGPDGLKGDDGADGRHAWVRSSTLVPGSACDHGGVRFEYGFDEDGSGSLEPDEVDPGQPPAFVCHGEPGPPTPGPPGPGIAANPAPADAETCPTGGSLVTFAPDDGSGGGVAGDGDLQPGEAAANTAFTVPVCNGPEGPPTTDPGPDGPQGEKGEQGDPGHSVALNWTAIPEGPTCPTGGQRVRLGIDDGDGDGAEADNGDLEASEVDETLMICNGSLGPTGPPGSPGGVDQMWIPQVPDQSKGGVIDGSATGTDVGEYTSITIGIDGIPIIAYYDNSSKNLKVAHCGTITCSAPNPRTLDSGGDVGQYASIAIRPNGLPMVAYYDATNGDLKAVGCTNIWCTSFDAPVVVDTGFLGADVGRFVVLTMVNGGPVYDYYDATNGDLLRTACGGLTCIAPESFLVLDSAGDSGRYLASTGRSVAYYHIPEDGGAPEIRVVQCPPQFTSLGCYSGVTWAENAEVDSRMAWVNGRVYYHSPTPTAYWFVPGPSSASTLVTMTNLPTGHMAWAATKPDADAVWVYSAQTPPNGNVYLQMRRCPTSCSTTPIDGTYGSSLADYTYPSVTVDPWDFPVMAYHDESAGTLRFVRAPNPILDEWYWHR